MTKLATLKISYSFGGATSYEAYRSLFLPQAFIMRSHHLYAGCVSDEGLSLDDAKLDIRSSSTTFLYPALGGQELVFGLPNLIDSAYSFPV